LDLKQIKLIIDLMKRSELTEFAIEEEGLKLKICRSNTSGVPYVEGSRGSAAPFLPVAAPAQPVVAPVASPAAPTSPVAPAAAEESGIIFVKSPMVGTFYRSASPDSKSFADVGTKLVENTPVCIIEAMKIMNEIQAEVRGTVLEVLVENGQPVEYGQKLFKVKQG
jgi:acetyl-CoA carboxylase biotin carboxyl carrier protein